MRTPFHIEVSRASATAIEAIEKAGGTVTCVHFNRCVRARARRVGSARFGFVLLISAGGLEESINPHHGFWLLATDGTGQHALTNSTSFQISHRSLALRALLRPEAFLPDVAPQGDADEAAAAAASAVDGDAAAPAVVTEEELSRHLPRRARPPPKLMPFYLDYDRRGYLSPEVQVRNKALFNGKVTSEPLPKVEGIVGGGK